MPFSLGLAVIERERRYVFKDRSDRVFFNVCRVVQLLDGNHLLTMRSGEVTEVARGWSRIVIKEV